MESNKHIELSKTIREWEVATALYSGSIPTIPTSLSKQIQRMVCPVVCSQLDSLSKLHTSVIIAISLFSQLPISRNINSPLCNAETGSGL